MYVHTYVHTYIHTYVYTYIQTYIHIYIHTYIHTYRGEETLSQLQDILTYFHHYCSASCILHIQFNSRHSMDNVLHDWLFPHHCIYMCIHTYVYIHTYIYTCIHTYIYTHTYICYVYYICVCAFMISLRCHFPVPSILLLFLLKDDIITPTTGSDLLNETPGTAKLGLLV